MKANEFDKRFDDAKDSSIKPLSRPPAIAVAAYCDLDSKLERRPLWGEYWIKRRLEEEFIRQGFQVDNTEPEILIHLFGSPMSDLPKAPIKILWIHSHPDKINPGVLAGYNMIYCISRPYIEKIRRMGFEAEWLMLPTHMKKPLRSEKAAINRLHDTVFVGNNRRNCLRKLVQDLLTIKDRLKSSISIWGNGWGDGVIAAEWYCGPEYPNNKLNELYSSSRIVLNDHHNDMAREGFINPRILDALAADALVITDPVYGLENLVDIPVYHNPEDLARLINHYLASENQRHKTVSAARERIKGFTYRKAVKKIIMDMQD